MKNRVVVTGIGTVNALGVGVSNSWNQLLSGKKSISDDGSLNIDFAQYGLSSGRLGKFMKLSMISTDEAIQDSNLNEIQLENASVIIGSGIGGLEEIQKSSNKLLEKNYIEKYGNNYRNDKNVISPYFIISSLINLASGNISIKYGTKGLNKSIVTACASGAHAIIDGVRMILLGEAECVITGGTESCVCPISMWGFNAMHALYKSNDLPLCNASMPFDINRAGFVMSEGSATLVLEKYESAVARGAKIYGEIAGYGFSSDASHITKPSPDGAFRSMKMALGDYDMTDLCVNAHATSTPLGDQSELSALEQLFHDKQIDVTANKSATGHTLGASGAIEAVFSLMSLQDKIVPKIYNTKNCISHNDNINIALENISRPNLKYVLSNSFGFGGTNASILFKSIN